MLDPRHSLQLLQRWSFCVGHARVCSIPRILCSSSSFGLDACFARGVAGWSVALEPRSGVFSLPVRLGIACLDVGASSRCRQFSLCLMWHSPQSLWLSTGHPAGGVHADVHLTIQKFSNPINGLGSAAIRRAGLNGRARRAIDERGGEGQQSDLGGTSSPARVRRHASSPGSYVQDESRVRGQCQRDVTHVT